MSLVFLAKSQTIDLSFGIDGKKNLEDHASIRSAILQNDGKLLLGGLKNASGVLYLVGTNNANVSSTSEPGRVFFFGNKYTVPVAGSIADILNKGTGKLHVAGENAELHLTQIPSFKSVVLNWQGNILSLAVPGYYPEIKFDFGNKILKLPGWTVDNSL